MPVAPGGTSIVDSCHDVSMPPIAPRTSCLGPSKDECGGGRPNAIRPRSILTDCKVFPVKPRPPAHAAIGLIMRSFFHCWHAISIAVLAVVFFSSVHPTHSAERVPVEGKSPADIVVIPGPTV